MTNGWVANAAYINSGWFTINQCQQIHNLAFKVGLGLAAVYICMFVVLFGCLLKSTSTLYKTGLIIYTVICAFLRPVC